MLAALVITLFSTIITAQSLSSALVRNSGAISYPSTRIVYIMINATATYELSSTFQVITYSTDSLTVLNQAIQDVSLLKGSLFVYNGTYQVNGAINMQSNVNMTLQDGVFINETGSNGGSGFNIFTFSSVANASINADSNVTIHGIGSSAKYERAFWFSDNVDNIAISASHPNGLRIYNLGYNIMENYQPRWVNNSLFQNIWAYNWMMSFVYPWHGNVHDGVQNCQFINLTVDGANGDSRSPLCIGGSSIPSNNITISGGIYENSLQDNGIYLGAWALPVTNVLIVNVTTSGNNAVAQSGHSGLKFRPTSNVTVINWTSNGDYNGMELGSTDKAVNFGGSEYNNISGTINSPVNCGLILSMDFATTDHHVAYNWFNITVNNATRSALWIADGFANTTSINNNTIYLTAIGGQRQAVDFANLAGNISYNTIYGKFTQNGKMGFTDISFGNITAQNYNVINVYSTTGNPYGLYSGNLGTNIVNYPYSGP